MSSVTLDLRGPSAAPVPTEETEADSGATEAPDAQGPPEPAAPGPEEPPAGEPPAPERLRCATCGTLVAADAPAHDRADAPWHVPVHAGLPDPVDPFTARPCPGSGAVADPHAPPPETADATPAAPAALLPRGLHWRDQPFSHGAS